MKWINCNERMPEIDNVSDFPREYIIRCKADGGRGYTDAFLIPANKFKDAMDGFDYSEWLYEDTPSFGIEDMKSAFIEGAGGELGFLTFMKEEYNIDL